MPNVIIRIICLVSGVPTPFDGKYVKAYDPTYHYAPGEYDGGLLEVTDDPKQALQFPNVGAAMAKWKQSAGCECHGKRVDGRPNAPLTAWNVEIYTPVGVLPVIFPEMQFKSK